MDNNLKIALDEVVKEINTYIENCSYFDSFSIKDISVGLRAYFERGGKRIRPAFALWSCGLCGGDPKKVIPAAAGLEACHTWTLIHDDIIDNDTVRRGGDSVHEIGRKQAEKDFSFGDFRKYGETYGILVGDILQGISVSMILDSINSGVKPETAVAVCKFLETDTNLQLIEGELLDVRFEYMDENEISPDLIYKMIQGKTGALIKYSAMMGAMIGLETCDVNHPLVKKIGDFALKIGLAFQLRDDILGLTADEKKLGKPVGSDIAEGKKTLTAFYALGSFDKKEKEEFLSVFGKTDDPEKIRRATEMIIASGALKKTEEEEEKLLAEALDVLSSFPDNKYRKLLEDFADYMLRRDY